MPAMLDNQGIKEVLGYGCMEVNLEYLASEESLWDLYERWRSHHTISLDLTEKQKRFNVFQGESETYPQCEPNGKALQVRT
ncbi:hypothetical protein Goshw_001759 [Gossypium schwendimanii]|uniref:Uncharacterized protein n=1 Tax=Gossypium schwendimanii TaxID=34291 RepID=A0A7J9KPK2_GOSSC|nr:hypothetical protein [Gossypium schwendimanii]